MRHLLFLLVPLLAACRPSPPPALGHVPFADDFDRAELGPRWTVSGGYWVIRDGEVYTTGAHNAPLFLNVDLPADVVVECDVKSDTPAVDSKIELMTNGRAHASGYIFILGGWHNAISAIARLDEHGTDRRERRPTGVAGNRWYHWRVEKRGGEIRWSLDGRPYLTFHDPAPLDGPGHDRLAFSNWENQVHYDHLRIWPYAGAPPIGTGTRTGTRTSTTGAKP